MKSEVCVAKQNTFLPEEGLIQILYYLQFNFNNIMKLQTFLTVYIQKKYILSKNNSTNFNFLYLQ